MPLGNSRLISADSHFTEPGDLFQKRVPSKFKDCAPHMKRFDEGDAWIIEGVKDPINFGMNACAGLAPEDMKGWVRFEDMRAGGYDPKARLQEMDTDGVYGEVMYPTPRLSAGIFATPDEEKHRAYVRAYNEWQAEYVAHCPDRFCGLIMMPNLGGPKAVIEEIEKFITKPGMRGVTMGRYPNGTTVLQPEDDPVWEYLESKDIALSIHVALVGGMPSAHKAKLPGYGRFFDAPNRMIEMIFNGVFDRFPKLQVAFAEVDFGWVPYVKEQIDNNYQRLDAVSKFGLQRMPSEYIDEHFSFGYMTDTLGLRNLNYMNPEKVLWSTDYPHISADYPYSWRTIQASTSGISQRDRDLILHGNAERLYKFKPLSAAKTQKPKISAVA